MKKKSTVIMFVTGILILFLGMFVGYNVSPWQDKYPGEAWRYVGYNDRADEFCVDKGYDRVSSFYVVDIDGTSNQRFVVHLYCQNDGTEIDISDDGHYIWSAEFLPTFEVPS